VPRLITNGELQYHGDELTEKLVEYMGGSREVLAMGRDERSPYEAIHVAWLDLLKTEGGADELCAAVSKLLRHPDAVVRSNALHFFASAHTADADETLLELLADESPLYSGVLDPEEEGALELRDVLTLAVSQRVERLGLRARDVIRREAMCPGRARWAIAHLGWEDAEWLIEHAIPIVLGTPAVLGTLLYYLQAHNQDVRAFLNSLREFWSDEMIASVITETCAERADTYNSLLTLSEASSNESVRSLSAQANSTGTPRLGSGGEGNISLLRYQVSVARQLPTQAEQAARLYFLGNALAELSGGHVEEGLTVLREAAQLGSHHAAYDAALILFHGEDVARDLVAARVLLEQAAESEAPWAAYELSIWLRQGIGGAVETERADNLEELAAKTGHPQACMNRGARIANGELGEIEMDEVVALYVRAAEGGSANAAARLFLMYLNGDGIDADEQQAKTWFARAEQLGFDWDNLK